MVARDTLMDMLTYLVGMMIKFINMVCCISKYLKISLEIHWKYRQGTWWTS